MDGTLTLTGYELVALGLIQIFAFLCFEVIARGISLATDFLIKKLKLRKEDKNSV